MLRALWTSQRWAECRGLRAVHRSVETRLVLRLSLRRSALLVSLPCSLPPCLFLSLTFSRSQFSVLSPPRTLRAASNSAAACSADPCILQAARNVAAGTSLSHHHVESITRVRGKTDRKRPYPPWCLFLSHSGRHFGIDEWRWMTSRFFKGRTSHSFHLTSSAMKLYGDSSLPKIGRLASAFGCQWD